MDKGTFKDLCTVGAGAAVTATGAAVMYASATPLLDIGMDAAQVAAAVAAGIMTGGMGLALLGLSPLAVKYTYKLYNFLKEKFQSNHHITEKDTSKMESTHGNSSKTRGHLKGLEKGYTQSFNRSERRSAHNPTPRARTIPPKVVPTIQPDRMD